MAYTAIEVDLLRMLRRSADPLSGRQIADIIGVAPNTANRLLKGLMKQGLLSSTTEGRATRWTTTADVAELSELRGSPTEGVVLIVTAVELEHTEVRNRLVNTKRVRVGGISMLSGDVPGAGINWTVYLGRAGMGNATSAALVGLAAGELHADLVAFVGTAAGLKPSDHRHGDVVIANRIHNPYAGKQVSTGTGSKLLGRDKTYSVPAPLLSLVGACIEDSSWTSSMRSHHYSATHPHAFVAPIVSVEAVQTDTNGPVMAEISSRFQDAAALDMESFGLAAGSDIHALPVLVVRGLSDFVDDKTASTDEDRQPRAAANAAGMLRDILVFAGPDDFKLVGGPPSVQGGPPNSELDTTDIQLPGGLQVWIERLKARSVSRAASAMAAVTEMRRGNVSAATWLSRALHRPPAWLREDDTGDGWALVSSLASLAGSTIAWRGFEHAAKAAALTGSGETQAYFTLAARVDRLGDVLDALDGDEESATHVFDDLSEDVLTRFGSVVRFYQARARADVAEAKAGAEAALAALGLQDTNGVLRVPEGPSTTALLDAELRDMLGASILCVLALMMLAPGAADQLGVQSGMAARGVRGNPLTGDLADDGLQLAEWALTLRPKSEGVRLVHAQALLVMLVALSGREADPNGNVSKRAKTVESEALRSREVYRDWGSAQAGTALAIAAHARALQGDAVGALRLLLPAPDGVATQPEARHADVVRLSAQIARLAGKNELALELAAKSPDPIDRQLLRAAVLSGRPQMAQEAKAALLAALDLSTGSSEHRSTQPLLALTRLFNSLGPTEQETVTARIDALEARDSDLAEVLRARINLSQGDTQTAMTRVRALTQSELALETHADALVAAGRVMDAATLVFNEGVRRGDTPLVTEALEIAMKGGQLAYAREIALHLLADDQGRPVHLTAVRALQQIAYEQHQWQEVAVRTEQAMRAMADSELPVPEIEYWRLAEALYFQEQFDRAATVLVNAPDVRFDRREKAQLFLSILRRDIDDQRSPRRGLTKTSLTLANPTVYTLFARAASDWAADEQIAATALSVVLMAPGAPLDDLQIAEFRKYAEDYFARHGENASIKQVKVEEDNLEPLIEVLRRGSDHRHAVEDAALEVQAGRYPLTVLAEIAGRTCTEMLIRRDVGYVLAVEDDAGQGVRAAKLALNGRAVVDTTAVVVAPWTGIAFKRLAAHFDAVVIPAPVREDIARARGSLAMKSTGTMGWNAREQRPTLFEITEEQAEELAVDAEAVWADIQGLQVAPVTGATRVDEWLSAITVAKELGIPLWADDTAMRRLARSMDVEAFGSLDLIEATADAATVATATAALRENKVVDLPLDAPWDLMAARSDWDLGSAFALALSRPVVWADLPSAWSQFRLLFRRRPADMEAARVAQWAYLAANGLALATAPAVRPKVISALLTWVVFNADPVFADVYSGSGEPGTPTLAEHSGRVTELVIDAAQQLGERYYPAADSLIAFVDVLCESLISTVGPAATSRVIATLVSRLDAAVGRRVFAAFMQSAGD
ncbi:helix-turn-helix domain-containing protein [Cellulomonas sp. URHD0024]|uniref:5'-methylthioadenosine/S-adenosylhomocysteine nucleosidase family protein n=1 Tax=Cellulomonas sp. URHD0024 TaxID=1302620 RepID=UPI00048A4277|nr:helix-turn-helix domain-containing protein [Cellulomonas sp. URHD0024]